MEAEAPLQPGPSPIESGWVKAVSLAALAAAWVFAALLGIRTLTTNDFGNLLAHGEEFLATGRLVDHDPALYTLPPEDLAPSERPEPGPGCWYDEQGRYRFPNANWLTQALMISAYRVGGIDGLCALVALTVAALFAVLAVATRRLGAPWVLAAAGLVAIGLASYARLCLRPELFGYLVLAVQLLLLSRAMRDGAAARPIGAGPAAGLIGAQLLFVNLHSYFFLGIGLTGAVFFEQLLRWLRSRRRSPDDAARLRRVALRTGAVLVGQVAVCFANPWTWRLVALPFQTALYMQTHRITAPDSTHPWSIIVELRGAPAAAGALFHVALRWIVRLAAFAAAAALWRRRWGSVLVLAAMIAVGMSVPRNAAVAALLLVPGSLACLWPLVAQQCGRRAARPAAAVLAVAVVAASAWCGARTVTNRFYFGEYGPERFGFGISRAILPVGAVEWLDRHLPGERIWCDFSSSSYIRFFSRPQRELPILTNTWTFPPAVLAESAEYGLARRPLSELADRYGFGAVVLRADQYGRLFEALARDPEWAVVHLEGKHAVFLQTSGPLAGLARRAELSPERLRRERFLEQTRALDPVAAYPLLAAAQSLSMLGWHDLAVEAADMATDDEPESPFTWFGLGLTFSARGDARWAAGDLSHEDDRARAAGCFRRALALDPDYGAARKHLDRLGRAGGGPVPR